MAFKNSVIQIEGGVAAGTVQNSGKGYDADNLPSVTVDAPPSGGIRAVAAAVVENTRVADIRFSNNGAGYVRQPRIRVAAPTKTRATATATVNADTQVSALTVTEDGAGYDPDNNPPEVTIADPVGGTATATVRIANNGRIAANGVTITNAGRGYDADDPPAITLTSAQGSGGELEPVIAGGKITGINIRNRGSGYNRNSPPTITIAPPPDVVTATAAATVNSNGKISGLTVVNPGRGYDPASAPAVTVAAPPDGTAATAIAEMELDNSTVLYTVPSSKTAVVFGVMLADNRIGERPVRVNMISIADDEGTSLAVGRGSGRNGAAQPGENLLSSRLTLIADDELYFALGDDLYGRSGEAGPRVTVFYDEQDA